MVPFFFFLDQTVHLKLLVSGIWQESFQTFPRDDASGMAAGQGEGWGRGEEARGTL